MRNKATKIALIILSGLVLYSCSLVRRVPEGKHLLEKNEVRVNGELKTDDQHKAQLYQQPNTNILGYHLRLHMFNIAKPDADSSYRAWLDRKPGRHEFYRSVLSEKQVMRLGNSFIVLGISNFLKRTGEPPVLTDLTRAKKSRNRLYAYYYKQGFFRATAAYTVDTLPDKRAIVNYTIATGRPYVVDSITPYIQTPVLDSLYNLSKNEAVLKNGKQYLESDFTAERERITTYFRNHGAFTFQQNNINYVVDTVNTNYKANVDLVIDNESIRQGDSTLVRPFKLYKISQVNIYTKNPGSDQAIDSTNYNGFRIFSTGKLNYKPKALTDAVFIAPGSTYSDQRRVLTSRYLNNLTVFNYPTITYVQDSTDTSGQSLITNIYLSPRKKFKFNVAADFNHSNIQDFGIQGSLGVSIRNIFKGAETLVISTRGNIGSSRDPAITDRDFFNVLEYGADAKLTFPRIWFPINTERIIPKRAIPNTILSLGISRQKNIGLDKENFNGVLSYNWTPKRSHTAKFDLFNIQYIRNVNPQKYFKVYRSSYTRINDIAQTYTTVNPAYFDTFGNLTYPDSGNGISNFISDVQADNITLSATDKRDVDRLEERRKRLVENNLIVSSSYTFTITTRESLTDKQFFIFKTKLEGAGLIPAAISGIVPENKGVPVGSRTIFDVQYSQYVKGELDFIKHFDLGGNKELAMRAFFGLAVPYGNARSIPFTRSYFAGGSNDNRAWQSYSLGPGSSGGINDFNEANLKMSYSTEIRYNIFGKLNGAIFGDVGNIWNIFDQETDKTRTFNGFKSFKDLALGTGTGFRYDFNFFVVRFDVGFKTYDPGRPEGTRWLKGYNFSDAVLNVGINYPF